MNPPFKKVHSELQRGMRLSKCRKCGCMRGTLENLKTFLPLLEQKDAKVLLRNVNEWFDKLEPLEYACFGCKYCIPPEAMNILTSKYPSLASATLSTCDLKARDNSWPPVEGEYTVLDKSASVAVSTLASVKLEEKLARLSPPGLCIVGKTETENIGIDKIVKNVISNTSIHSLIVAGKDPEGHQSGNTLLALWKNGVDKNMRIIGSKARRPILKNVTRSDIDNFRKQIYIDDQIGCENSRTLAKRIKELSQRLSPVSLVRNTGQGLVSRGAKNVSSCGCHGDCNDQTTMSKPLLKPVTPIPKITAKKQNKSSIKLDKAGYFVILPSKKNGSILVEHYSYDNKLLRKIEGKSSRDVYLTIINNKWVKELSHAAYLGKELARAELSIKKGFKFIQDGA